MTTIAQSDLELIMRERFGDDPMNWAFVCPMCKDVATLQDHLDAFPDNRQRASDGFGRQCIGRLLGALESSSDEAWIASGGRGCDWCAWGLFGGPIGIVMPNGTEVRAFQPAGDPL